MTNGAEATYLSILLKGTGGVFLFQLSANDNNNNNSAYSREFNAPDTPETRARVYLRDYGKRGGRRTPLSLIYTVGHRWTYTAPKGCCARSLSLSLSLSLVRLPPYIAMVSKHACPRVWTQNALSSPFEIDFHRLVVRKLAGRDACARAHA